MVKAAALGDEVERIARWSGRAVETVAHWLARFAAGGVGALADAPRSGRPVHADAGDLAAMDAALESPPTQLGFALDVWTSERWSVSLEQQTGAHICAGWRRALVAEHGGVCGRPQHTRKHVHDPAAVAAAQAELAAVGEQGARGAGALRAALPGRDASADHSPAVSDLASPGQTTDGARRGDQWARHGMWQRRSAGTRAGGTGARRPGHRRVRALRSCATFVRYLELLEAHQQAVGREISRVLDQGSAHTSRRSTQAVRQRRGWRHVIWLAKSAPQLNAKEREWRSLKRDARSHLAASLRDFVDDILVGLRPLGGTCCMMVDEGPQWFLDGRRQPPTGRSVGRPVGATDSYKRAPYRLTKNLPTDT